MEVKCIGIKEGYFFLTLNKTYSVATESGGDYYFIKNNNGDFCYYPKELFVEIKKYTYAGINEYRFPINIKAWGIEKGDIAAQIDERNYKIYDIIIPTEIIEAIESQSNREAELKKCFEDSRANHLVHKYESFEHYVSQKSGTQRIQTVEHDYDFSKPHFIITA